MTTWSNVAFWDNYWENTFWYPHGESVSGAHNVQLSNLDGGYPTLSGGAHSDVHLWYHGTVDLSSAVPYDGAYFGLSTWYAGAQGPQDRTGFYFSSIAEGNRPAGGVPKSLGGGADRQDIDLSSAVWPNIIDLAMVNPDSRVEKGDVFPVTYWYQDHDSGTAVAYFLDSDKNPYNGNEIQAGQTSDGQPRADLTACVQDVSTAAAEAGSYYVFAKISDGSHTRYVYAPGSLTVVAPDVLGGVDFLNRPFPGNSWYRLEAVHDAILTVETLASGVEIELFDADFTRLAAGRRVDWPAEIGQSFYFYVNGSDDSSVLRIANLVRHESAAVAVSGTAGGDQFVFDASAALRQVSVNEVVYTFGAAEAVSFDFDGAGGNDTVRLVGGADVDTAQLRPRRVVLNGSGYRVTADDIESAAFDGGGGKDVALLHGGPGVDVLAAGGEAPAADPHRAVLSGNGVSLTATAEIVCAYGNGGHNAAYLYDSPGIDVFQPFWRWSRMWGDPDPAVDGDEYHRLAMGFQEVVAYADDSAGAQSLAGDDHERAGLLGSAPAEVGFQPPDEVFVLAQILWLDGSGKTSRQTSVSENRAIDNIDRVFAYWQ
jgi:hypothetical protein